MRLGFSGNGGFDVYAAGGQIDERDMSQTAPSDRDTAASGDTDRAGEATAESGGTPWKQAVAAVTSTMADAAVDAVTIVGDAARTLTSRSGDGDEKPPASRARTRPSSSRGNGTNPSSPSGNGRRRRTWERPRRPSDEPRTRRRTTTAAPAASPAGRSPTPANGAASAGKAPEATSDASSDTGTPADQGAGTRAGRRTNGKGTTTPDAPLQSDRASGDGTATPGAAPGAKRTNGKGTTTLDPAPPGDGRTPAGTGTDAATPNGAAAPDTKGAATGTATRRPPPAPAGDDRAAAPAAAATALREPPARTGARGRHTREAAWLAPLRRRRETDRPWLVRAGMFALVSVAGLAAIVVAAVALVPRAVAYASESADAELILPDDAAFDPLAQRTRVLYADGSLLAILHGEEDRNPVSLEKMPDHAWQAVVAAEDKKFFEHDGYDPAGIGRALFANMQAGSVSQGGSTISQQVARLNFKEVGLDQSIERKLKEVAYAVALEERFTKEEILDRYVNQVYFGSGAYGLQAASEEYFDTNVANITPDQAALLAGLISSPSAYNPRVNPELAREQRDLVLDSMVRTGYLTREEGEEYKAKKLKVAPPPEGTNKQPSIIEEVMRDVKANPVFGATVQEREDNLFNGGLRIRTTIRPRLQKLAERTVVSRFGKSGKGVTAAIAAVDPRTGAVKAVASAKRLNKQNFNVAIRGRRQPGSAFKPFVMAEALRQGFSPSTTLEANSPMVFPQRYGPAWSVSNYGGASYGTLDMAAATKSSVNTYFAQLIQLVGVERAVAMAEKLGLAREGIGEEGFYGPAIVLGGMNQGATPLEMASAYGTFANNGIHIEPYLIEQVKRGNEVLFKEQLRKTQVLKPAVNAAALRLLEGPPSYGGTAPIADLPSWPVAGKTGTTQLATDAWFVGTTPVLSTAVWVGHKDSQVRMYGATGGGTAAPVWRQFMDAALANREPRNFPSVNESEFVGRTVNVPNVIGLSEQDALSKLAKKKLIGRAQFQASAAPAGSVLWVSPSDSAQVGTTVYVGVSTGVPPPPPPPPEPEPEPDDAPERRSRDNRPDNSGNGNGGGRGNDD
jgi:penicillin-binding protein 1A